MSDWREKYLESKIKGKIVLDLGVGDTRHRSLHPYIKTVAKKLVGIELDPMRAEKLRKQGYNVKTGNAETTLLNQTFDVVIAGDLIEHLNNPGVFLETVKKHMKKEGMFIFNTPNAYSINLIIRALINLGKVKQFDEHTFIFTEDLLKELLNRHKMKIIKVIYFSHKNKDLNSKIIRFFGNISKYWYENMMIEVQLQTKKG